MEIKFEKMKLELTLDKHGEQFDLWLLEKIRIKEFPIDIMLTKVDMTEWHGVSRYSYTFEGFNGKIVATKEDEPEHLPIETDPNSSDLDISKTKDYNPEIGKEPEQNKCDIQGFNPELVEQNEDLSIASIQLNGDTIYPGDVTIKENITTLGSGCDIEWPLNLETLTKQDLAHIIGTLQSQIKRDAAYIEALKSKLRGVR